MSVEKYLEFAGWGHSGHTLVAAILDSHPNIAILNGYHSAKSLEEFFELRKSSKNAYGLHSGMIYSYTLDGQGKGENYKVIGHTNTEHTSPTFGVAVVRICCIRHPKNIIDWRCNKRKDTVENILKWFEDITKNILNDDTPLFQLCIEEWAEDPERILYELCKFLDIESNKKWRDNALTIVNPTQPRIDPKWRESDIHRLEKIIRGYPMFERYV